MTTRTTTSVEETARWEVVCVTDNSNHELSNGDGRLLRRQALNRSRKARFYLRDFKDFVNILSDLPVRNVSILELTN